MQTTNQSQKTKIGWKEKLLNLFRLTAVPSIKVYNGYGHAHCITVYGHVFKLSPIARKKYRKSLIRNTIALLRLFAVKPYPCVQLELDWKGKTYYAEAGKDGFFRFEWKDEAQTEKGWHPVQVRAVSGDNIIATAKGEVHIPGDTQYIYISDIDDTFLISHSSALRKRLFVLFTNNPRSRQPFEGVVKYYQLLQHSQTTPDAPNPFFYVSSSEWNLYEYLLEFKNEHEIPKGVYLLNQLKTFSKLLKTGSNNHHTKFARIVRIMEAYPNQRVVLLGDSSQQDPYIYRSIVQHFPRQVHAVYIRDIHHKNQAAVADVLKDIESAGVACCFFAHSADAILHSIKIDLIPPSAIKEAKEADILEEDL